MEKNKLNQNIIKGLASDDKSRQLEAIKQIRAEGYTDYLPVLADLYIRSQKTEIKDKISVLFQDLKDSASVPVIVNLLNTTSNDDLRSMLLTACWSSSLDFSKYIYDLVELAIGFDYMVAFEVLTVIENLEKMPSKTSLEQGISRLKSCAAGMQNSKKEIVLELIQVLEDFMQSNDN